MGDEKLSVTNPLMSPAWYMRNGFAIRFLNAVFLHNLNCIAKFRLQNSFWQSAGIGLCYLFNVLLLINGIVLRNKTKFYMNFN